MRAAIVVFIAACGSSPAPSPHAAAPTPAPAPTPTAPAANPVVTVTADTIDAGDLHTGIPEDPYSGFTALRDALAAQLHGAAHPAIAITADARGDVALLAIAALMATGADHVDVRAQRDQHRVCDVGRPPERPAMHEVDVTGSGAAPPPRAEISVLVTADATWIAVTGGVIQKVDPDSVAKVVAKIGADAAFHGRTDVEIAVDEHVPASALLDAIGALCPRFPALRVTSPDGLSTRPTM